MTIPLDKEPNEPYFPNPFPAPHEPYNPPEPEPTSKKKWLWTVAIGALLGVAAGAVIISAGSSSAKPQGFNNADVLAVDVEQTAEANADDGSTVDVSCIHDSGTQFTCHATWDDGHQETVPVTVAKDGQTWISGH